MDLNVIAFDQLAVDLHRMLLEMPAQVMTVDDVDMVIADIQSDFSRGGHTLHYVE